MTQHRLLVVTLALLAGAAACSDVIDLGAERTPRGEAGQAGAAGLAGSQEAARECQGHIYHCGDGIDNDADGLIDAADPDCTGACDNTEDSYYGGIPGQNNAPCRQDCYFDQDTGPGNDGCAWSAACDPLSIGPDFPPTGDPQCSYDPSTMVPGVGANCTSLLGAQSAQCAEVCGDLTPNGCDCFGCCELPAGSARYVWLGSTLGGVGSCEATALDDPTKCKPCTPVPSCLNPCERCERCVGKPALPPECAEAVSCPRGVQPCGASGQAACPLSAYCITGCCQPLPH